MSASYDHAEVGSTSSCGSPSLVDQNQGVITARLVLRRWRDDDQVPFAALNADPVVMRYFPELLDRRASDDLIQRIEQGFDANGLGHWAAEHP